PPIAITSIFPPTYTLGRRERSISVSQREHLRADGRAGVVSTQRGGQITFHGPGQMTGYLLLDLQRQRMTPRCYIRMLEDSVISCLSHYGITGFTTEDPGVWTSGTRKICAVGVHMRRNVTSFGVGLNVDTDLWWFDRIVACGLEGKEATSFVREG
ncbi:lipoyltransferase, partial [Wilcoxina mikolae CBS 423.85]